MKFGDHWRDGFVDHHRIPLLQIVTVSPLFSASLSNAAPGRSSETLICQLFRDRFQLRSGLVNLVIGVRDDGSGGHCLAIAGERFVGLIAENLAEVSNGGGQFWDTSKGYGIP